MSNKTQNEKDLELFQRAYNEGKLKNYQPVYPSRVKIACMNVCNAEIKKGTRKILEMKKGKLEFAEMPIDYPVPCKKFSPGQIITNEGDYFVITKRPTKAQPEHYNINWNTVNANRKGSGNYSIKLTTVNKGKIKAAQEKGRKIKRNINGTYASEYYRKTFPYYFLTALVFNAEYEPKSMKTVIKNLDITDNFQDKACVNHTSVLNDSTKANDNTKISHRKTRVLNADVKNLQFTKQPLNAILAEGKNGLQYLMFDHGEQEPYALITKTDSNGKTRMEKVTSDLKSIQFGEIKEYRGFFLPKVTTEELKQVVDENILKHHNYFIQPRYTDLGEIVLEFYLNNKLTKTIPLDSSKTYYSDMWYEPLHKGFYAVTEQQFKELKKGKLKALDLKESPFIPEKEYLQHVRELIKSNQ